MSTENINKELYYASLNGNLKKVKRLLAAGADVNAKFGGTRPLNVAADHGHIEVVRFLLDNGANIDGTDSDGRTATYNAARNNHTAIVDLLAFRGANVEKNTNYGWTPLMVAAANDAMETLVVFGAEIDAVTKSQTSLMLAVQYTGIGVVRLLLLLNADTTKIDRDGKTAFQWAKKDEVKQLFLDHEKKSPDEREQERGRALNRIRNRLMRWAHKEIVGICLAFAPLELPPYVLLWIVDFLPNYILVSHHKKIELITSVRNSIWKLKGREC